MFNFKDILLPLQESYKILRGLPLWKLSLLVLKYLYATMPAFLAFIDQQIKNQK